VRLPGDHTRYLKWHPDGERLDVARLHGARTQRTWTLTLRTALTTRAPYRLPLNGINPDGSVTTFDERDGETIRTTFQGVRERSRRVAIPPRYVKWDGTEGSRRTLFGLNRDLLVVDNDTYQPQARLSLPPPGAAGWPRGWWDQNTAWFAESSRGLLTWNTLDGQLRVLTSVTAPAQPHTYWSASAATHLLR
jgi:hypothetical protein